MYLFDTISNNKIKLKIILRKTCTEKLYFGVLEEEESFPSVLNTIYLTF